MPPAICGRWRPFFLNLPRYVLQSTMYLSKQDTKFSENSKHSETKDSDVLELAKATFSEFDPYINVFDCGKKITNSDGESNPIHLITQEACKFYGTWRKLSKDQRKTFKPVYEIGSRHGQEFHHWNHYQKHRFSSKMIAEHIRGEQTYYYTSSKRRQALIYLDIDAHNGETDELRAVELLQDICGTKKSSLWNPSSRGQNGYLKIRYGYIDNPDLSHPMFNDLSSDEIAKLRVRIRNGLNTCEFNSLVDRAQAAYRRYLKYYDIECKFELKGKVTEYTTNPIYGTLDIKSGSLAKFPFAGWSWDRLNEFKKQTTIGWYTWERQIQLLEKMLDEKEQSTNEPSIIEAAASCGMQSPTATDIYLTPTAIEGKPNKEVDPESCAFRRSHRDCKPFIREFFRKHHRTPEHQDFLAYLKENGLYSGEWDDPNSDRECRTKRVLDFALQTFDPNVMGKGEGRWAKFPKLKWLRRYATGRFGSMQGTSVKGKNKIIYGEDGLKSGLRIQQCQVPADFVQHCVCVILTCMEDLAENDGLPEERIVKAWELLPNAPRWNRDYYAIVRDHLERHGVVEIYDKKHRRNKCWRWRKGKNYPSSPAELKNKLKRIAGDGGDVCSSSFSSSTFIQITPYCVAVEEMEISGELTALDERPPPSQPP